MARRLFRIAFISFGIALSFVHVAAGAGPVHHSSTPTISWHRGYKVGDVLRYQMEGKNQERKYQLIATSLVEQDSEGAFFEQISWSDPPPRW